MLLLRNPENTDTFVYSPLQECDFVCNMQVSWYTKTKNNSKHSTEYI